MLTQKEILTSRQNPTVKKISALTDKKERRREGLFRFDGIKLFCEAVECGLDIKYVVVREDVARNSAISEALESAVEQGKIAPTAVIAVSEGVFEKLSEERAPEGIITVCAVMSKRHRTVDASECGGYRADDGERLLIAESLRDPGNLGTVIRSCAVLGIDRLIISDDCADIYNSKTIRGAMGGLFRLNIDTVPQSELPNVIGALRESGRRVYATALHNDAETIGRLELTGRDCFVIGNEGHGLSRQVIEACDACAIIPMREGSESLNAAAAASICIWETVRAK